ncbi:hypothetical protein [Amphritea pacifica]|uniref:Uncharacterized protein n=1 Tax=Amphritea pacifica TaxID=2811233 RepID=A0ABS2W243_9GAMM|nr:hypothetical protein [Amphritea pacifica]MBN0985787.1 hypothetical protein [Amphritea pacifica]MBN1005868.1 hypothetical protein [Amphritea pacifica]
MIIKFLTAVTLGSLVIASSAFAMNTLPKEPYSGYVVTHSEMKSDASGVGDQAARMDERAPIWNWDNSASR